MKRSLLIPRALMGLMVILIGVFLRYFAEYSADNKIVLSIFWSCITLLVVGTDILLRKQQKAYKEQKKRELRYQLLVKGSKDIILEYFIDEDKYVANRGLFTNREEDKEKVIEDLTGYIKQHEGVMESALKLIEECKTTTENSFYRECDFHYVEDGEEKTLWFQFEGFIVRDAHGKAESAIGKLHDITKWKRAQEKMRETRLLDVYLDRDDDEKHTVFQYISEESMELSEEDFVKLLESHKFVGKTLDKLKFATDMDATLRELLGRIGRYLQVDRIAILEFLPEDEEVVINYQWNANPKTELINYFTTLTKDELKKVSKFCDEVGYFELNPTVDNFMERYRNEEDFIQRNVMSVILGNQLWIPMVSEGKYSGAIFVDKFDTSPYTLIQKAVFSEITGSLTSYLDKIRADDANQSKSVFLSNMSHEIRTPMNAIIGMTEVALRNEMQSSTRECIEIIQSSARGLLTVINDILDFSKIESGKVEYVSSKYWVLSLINDVRSILENENAKKGLNLFFELSNTIPSVLEGDMARIKQVMINLGNNAIKYTEKGVVVVSLSYKKNLWQSDKPVFFRQRYRTGNQKRRFDETVQSI